MLIALKQLLGSSIQAADENVGTVKDLYFDGQNWKVRYLIADTGTWLPGRQVLLNPDDISKTDWSNQQIVVRQTKEQVQNSPHIDEDRPVSRQMEVELANYYNWPAYWEGGAVMGTPAPVLAEQVAADVRVAAELRQSMDDDPTLRSFNEVKGYQIATRDGQVGHVADFIVDDEHWFVRYLVVETGTWLSGRSVLLSPSWVEQVRWTDRSVVTDVTQDVIKDSPEFDPDALVNRQYEEQLHDYYSLRKYWS